MDGVYMCMKLVFTCHKTPPPTLTGCRLTLERIIQCFLFVNFLFYITLLSVFLRVDTDRLHKVTLIHNVRH
jgi:hypothetical protein